MNCQQCLAELATGSLRDLTPDSQVMKHCATCPDCAGITSLLRDKEYDAANLLNSLPPMSNPVAVAEGAVRTARRRRLGQMAVMASGTALVVTISIFAATIFVPAMNRADASRLSGLRTETIPLTCLSPQQAADIINPYVRSHGSTYYIPTSGISAITVRGTSAEVAKSWSLIRNFERDPSASCRAPRNGPIPPLDELNEALRAKSGQSGAPSDKAPTLPVKQ